MNSFVLGSDKTFFDGLAKQIHGDTQREEQPDDI